MTPPTVPEAGPQPVERPPIVFVQWRDSYVASDGWTDREESIESGRQMMQGPIMAAGFLIDDTEAGIVVAVGVNQHGDEVEGTIAIPRSAIVEIDRLEPSR